MASRYRVLPYVAALALCGALAPAAGAQTPDPDRVVVPLTDPGRPALLRVGTAQGSITIRGTSRQDVVIERRSGSGRSLRRRQAEPPPGFRRLTPADDFSVEERNNEISVEPSSFASRVDLGIEVPQKTSLQISSVNGGITIDSVDGALEIDNVNGNVTLTNVAGSVVANSVNGDVKAILTRANAEAPMAFTTLNGDVDVTLPPTVRANLRLRTDHGDVFTDFDLPPAPTRPLTRGSRLNDGRFRLDVERSITSTLNGGGPDIEMRSFNGSVYLRKGK